MHAFIPSIELKSSSTRLINHLISLSQPLFKDFEGSISHKMLATNRPLGIAQVQLIVNKRVIEINTFSIGLCVSITDPTHMRPIEGRQTHRAWFTRGIDRTPRQIKHTEFLASIPNGRNLGMCRRVVLQHNLIHSCCYHLTITYDHRTKRASTSVNTLLRKTNGQLHKACILLRIIPLFG